MERAGRLLLTALHNLIQLYRLAYRFITGPLKARWPKDRLGL